MQEEEDFDEIYDDFSADDHAIEATEKLRSFFDTDRNKVFFSRQLEVIHEQEYFHWNTSRAIRELEAEGLITLGPIINLPEEWRESWDCRWMLLVRWPREPWKDF